MSDDYLGYLKYEGKLVDEGMMDARKSAEALLAFDKALRFFLIAQNKGLSEIEFELPVRIRKGSWEALIPTTVADWIITTAALAGVKYATTAATEAAKRDFENIGFKDLISKSIELIQHLIRLGKHLGSTSIQSIDDLTWRNNNTEVGIPNSQGEYLYVPVELINHLQNDNHRLLESMASLVEDDRTLTIGIYSDSQAHEESITIKEKHFFISETDKDEILFPELKHGDKVSLEGKLTRGTQTSNSLGFQYKEHVLTCYPESGSIVKYKSALFLRCLIHGLITRADKRGFSNETRPKVIISSIEILEEEKTQMNLDL